MRHYCRTRVELHTGKVSGGDIWLATAEADGGLTRAMTIGTPFKSQSVATRMFP